MEENVSGKSGEMVECHYNGTITYIPVKLFVTMTARLSVGDKKFIRYKEGAVMYSMSEREFFKLAHDADAVYKRNSMSLVNVKRVDEYLEYLRVE